MRSFSLLLTLILILSELQAQDFSVYQRRVITSGKDTLPYRILFPQSFQPGKKYPLLIFLHGSGERGRDNEKQLIHGGDLFLKDDVRKNFPAIVLFPQCPDDSTWSHRIVKMDSITRRRLLFFPADSPPTVAEKLVKELCDSLMHGGIVDPDRIYLAGISLGAQGAYDLLIRYPNYFAAAFTIAGACNVDLMVEHCSRLPLWIFHGAKDDVVLPEYDRTLYAALKEKNAPVKYTEYAEANHNSWDSAFAEPDLLPWLFAQHK